ncbi:helix-turn-helix domain-containing protein [Streptomyces fuscigenes]|uniref:helix-turn-helix domain-containing protein n=1 Tax=Streptomyces fuscigenes TaxID=1528880 RepID=UPI001F207F89|nr:helix-turn-helix domain-containing protein [Streptomyces fuscigenes]MCF3960487.1 helix-turn-helix domain-containing protein [Streptomyces fuscigenes]
MKNKGESAAGPSEEQLQVLELARNTQEELRHLARLLLNPVAAQEVLEYAVLIQQRTETITSGVVLLARQRHLTWEAVATTMGLSSETVRRSYREEVCRKRLGQRVLPPATRVAAPSRTLSGDRARRQADTQPPGRLRSQGALAPVLSHMQKASGLPLRQLGLRARVSASYLSRVLSGEKWPTWELTERIAVALGADTDALYKVWADHKKHDRASSPGRQTSMPQPRPSARLPSGTSLAAGLRTLYKSAGCPSLRGLAEATDGALTADEIGALLRGKTSITWQQAVRLVRALGGEPDFFQHHWEHDTGQRVPLYPFV